jgi:integrase
MTYLRPGRPNYYIKCRLPGFGVIGPLSTGTRNRDRAKAMQTMLVELAIERPAIVTAIIEKKLALDAVYIAKLQRQLDQVLGSLSDPLLTEAAARYRKLTRDERVQHGLDVLVDLAPAGARLSYLTPRTIVELCAAARDGGRRLRDRKSKSPSKNKPRIQAVTEGTVRRTLYRAIAELLAHELGRGRMLHILGDIQKGQKPKPNKSRDVRLTPAEVARLLEACDEEFVLLVLAAMLTGVDQGPLLELVGRDYNERESTLVVRDSKTEYRDRTLELGAVAGLVFVRAAARAGDDGRLFPYTRWQVRKRFDAVREAARLPHVRFKDLRHVLATALEEAGGSVKDILLIRGHGNPETTLDYLGSQRGKHRELMDGAATVLGLGNTTFLKVQSGGA